MRAEHYIDAGNGTFLPPGSYVDVKNPVIAKNLDVLVSRGALVERDAPRPPRELAATPEGVQSHSPIQPDQDLPSDKAAKKGKRGQ